MSSAREYYDFLTTDPARASRERALKEETDRAGLDTTRMNQERMRGTIADEATNRRRQAEAEASDKAMAEEDAKLGQPPVAPVAEGAAEPAPAGAMAGRSDAAAPAAVAPSAPLKMSPAMLVKRAKEFRARGDHKSADALLSQATQASELEQDNASIAQATKLVRDPKTVQKVMSMLNKDPRVTVGTDGKGKFAITAQNAEGMAGMPDYLSEADMVKLIHGSNMLSTNPTRGLKIISEVSTALSAHLKEINESQLKVQKGNTDVDQAESQRISANAATVNANANATRAGIDKKTAAAAARTMDPKIAAQLEDLRVQLDALPDGDPRRVSLAQSYNRLYGQGALSMGKTVAPREPKGPEAMKANADGTYSQGGELFREDPDNPGQLVKLAKPGPSLADRIAAARAKGAGGAPGAAPLAQPGLQRGSTSMTPGLSRPVSAPTIQDVPDADLARVTPNHPNYQAAQAELDRRKSAQFGQPTPNAARFNSRQ